MTKFIDRILDRVTMYRLTLYYLVALVLAAFAFGFVGLVPHDPIAMGFSTAVILATCWIANRAFARVLTCLLTANRSILPGSFLH
jgi:Na+-transporting NADH:ubiquinone oxidoreductase subunit NqrB